MDTYVGECQNDCGGGVVIFGDVPRGSNPPSVVLTCRCGALIVAEAGMPIATEIATLLDEKADLMQGSSPAINSDVQDLKKAAKVLRKLAF